MKKTLLIAAFSLAVALMAFGTSTAHAGHRNHCRSGYGSNYGGYRGGRGLGGFVGGLLGGRNFGYGNCGYRNSGYRNYGGYYSGYNRSPGYRGIPYGNYGYGRGYGYGNSFQIRTPGFSLGIR